MDEVKMTDKKIIGVGNTAEVYDYGNGKVCKLFFEGYPYEYVELEYKNANEIYLHKLSIPQPFEIVSENNRYGIVYEKVEGKTLLELMQVEEEDRDRIDKFVKIHKELLSKRTKEILSYKEFLISMLKIKQVNDSRLIDDINGLPDGDCLLHGDFHPGNILIKENSSYVIIDFMNVCYGPALFDIARTFFLIRENDEDLAKRYLDKMSVNKNKIVDYLNVIEKCRQYE